MKRKELLKHLQTQGCELIREGAKHSWWHNPAQNKEIRGSEAFGDKRHSGEKDMQRSWNRASEVAANQRIKLTSNCGAAYARR